MSARTTPARDPWLDNAKMALVTLVVVGHAWSLLPRGVVHDGLYNFLYAWHMPAFVLITGYLSRGFSWTGPRLWQLVHTVAVPYVVFSTALTLFRVHLGGETIGDVFVDPTWPLWYLAAVFLWRLATPLFQRTGAATAVALAVLLSLAGGMWAGDLLDLARVMGLLPFFVLGLKATPEALERLRARPVQVTAVVVLVAVVALAGRLGERLSTSWLYYRSYGDLGASDPEAVALRAAVLLVGLACALSFLAIVPRRGGWFTRMGAASMIVYLFHGFAVKAALYAGFDRWAADHAAAATAVVVVAGVALSLLLAWSPVATRLDLVVDPFGHAQRHATKAVDLALASTGPAPEVPASEVVGASAAGSLRP